MKVVCALKIQESGENYLETILLLQKKNGSVRSVDVANALEYSKASISRAMGILRKAGFVIIEEGGNIKLTEEGLARANAVYERHQLISRFLVDTLALDPAIADRDACRIEHIISEETFERMKAHQNGKK